MTLLCDEDVLFVSDLKNHLREYEARSYKEAKWDSADLPHQAGAGEIVNKTSREVRAGSLSWGLGSPELRQLYGNNKCQNQANPWWASNGDHPSRR